MRKPGRPSKSDEAVRDDGPVIQRPADPAAVVQRYAGNRAVTQLLTGQGEALDPALRAQMQVQLGASFDDVRVHRGPTAEAAAASVDARAFTVGHDVVFGAGAYNPASRAGRQTLAHELTHVTQQRGGPAGGTLQPEGLAVSDPGDRFEREAAVAAAGVDGPVSPTSGPMIQRQPKAPAPADDTAIAAPFELGEFQNIGNYQSAAMVIRYWAAVLQDEANQNTKDGLAAPTDVAEIVKAARENENIWAGGGSEPFDKGNEKVLRDWFERYAKAINSMRSEQAAEAARRVRAIVDEMQKVQAAMAGAEPALRERQRSAFRAGSESELLKTADAIATVLDTALTTKSTIEEALAFSDSLRFLGGTGPGKIIDVSGKVGGVLAIAEKVNKWYAAFQLARTALDLMTPGKTSSGDAMKGVAAMSTIMSAGGTLLGASAGFTLYSNLYIGPMVSACLEQLKRIEDTLSRTNNRAWIQMGEFDYVNWSIEPGGRELFDYMLQVMRASTSADLPIPRGKANDYLVDNEDDFDAGIGGRDGMPMTGHLWWRDTDDDSVRPWLFRHRKDMWAMLYGDCPVPR
ncbi:DUF4157 domain-containing protein [Actinoplanes sp. NPDC051513]|uniref:DUF4157 domain-containing protein n=1 Tax=Actinoplanes sp. NPDC051513 TaxID=3363908 RepID=UPI0037A0CC05